MGGSRKVGEFHPARPPALIHLFCSRGFFIWKIPAIDNAIHRRRDECSQWMNSCGKNGSYICEDSLLAFSCNGKRYDVLRKLR